MTDDSNGSATPEHDSGLPGQDSGQNPPHGTDLTPAPPASDRRAAVLTTAVIAGFVVIGVAAAVIGSRGDDPPTTSATVAPSSGQVVTFPAQDQTHVEGPVDYPQMPPVGGPHADAWQNCGFYAERVAPENAVHSMEHGAVWITYGPDLPSEAQDGLRSLVAGYPYVLVSPLPGLEVPVVLSAWTKQLRLDAFDASQVEAFVAEFSQGAQTPEPGAPCTGGIGEPSA